MAFPAGITSRAPLLLIGCGHMGGALLKAWLANGLPKAKAVIAEPRGKKAIERALGIRGLRVHKTLPLALKAAPTPRVAVLAVKPQAIGVVLREALPLRGGKTLILSIAAGVRMATLAKTLSKNARIVRAMPNTAAAIGRAVSVFTANRKAGPADRRLASALLGAAGRVYETGDERLLDAVTAVSGSGPAYFFLMVEALAEAGRKAGLPRALAEILAVETFLGSAAVLETTAGHHITHRRRVTSKGGTTEAALKVLMGKGGLKPLMSKAVATAVRRGRQLSR